MRKDEDTHHLIAVRVTLRSYLRQFSGHSTTSTGTARISGCIHLMRLKEKLLILTSEVA